MIDFDSIDDWSPKLAEALQACVPASAGAEIAKAAPKYVEDSRDLLFKLAGRDAVIDAALAWAGSSVIAGYHGTRLSDEELALVRTMGLVPLKADNRRQRIERALSSHPRWNGVRHNLDSVIQRHGSGECAGRREQQVHLTLSRSGLADGFNHYLTHGSEFDQRVAHALLDKEGEDLLRADGKARILTFAVPGADALKAAHPHFTPDDVRRNGDTPNIINHFLKAWSYRLAHPEFQCRTLRVDCGMVFRDVVPSDWIKHVETLSL